jgi:carbon storage regulator
MLVLSRLLMEQVVIPTDKGNIVITVTDIKKGKIRLGIEAPQEIRIYRRELLESAPKPKEAS